MADKYRILVDAQVNPVTQADIDKAVAKNTPKVKLGVTIDSTQAQAEINKISEMYKKATAYGTTSSTGIKKSNLMTAAEYKQTSQGLTEVALAQVKLNNAQSFYSNVGASSSTGIKKSGLMTAAEYKQSAQGLKEAAEAQVKLNNAQKDFAEVGKTEPTKIKKSGLLTAKELDAMDVSWAKVGKTIGKDIVKFGEWIIAGTLVMQTLNQFKQMISYIVKLDTAMTNIKIITGKTDAEVNSLVGSYSKLAKEIGATTLQVADGAEQWLRAGKTADEAMELTRQSITLSKLGVMTAAEATKDLIAVLNGYKLAASEASSVVDKLIAVDNAAATSANDLATSLQYVAAVANQANVPLNKVIGLVATVSDVTQQSAESIGIAWKTIFTRISNVKVGKFIDLETGESINFCAVAA